MKRQVTAVIGRGFGDEGKGLATDWLCKDKMNSIVVKHNGGAQAGHTVDLKDGRRFVFHQLGSGSFRGAETFWARTYYPDLYKLNEEIDSFKVMSNVEPVIYADPDTGVTIILDVIMNHAIETLRAQMRHGSCGMGINEADLRTKAGYGIKISELTNFSLTDLVARMHGIRDEYYTNRMAELGINRLPTEYEELFYCDEVLENAAELMLRNLSYIRIKKAIDILPYKENVVFETGQGLLLDGCNEKYFPNVTASRTGLTNILMILNECGMKLDEALYVARSYITRHGAGLLEHEVRKEEISHTILDLTNQPNEWQGALRYGLYDSWDELIEPICNDADCNAGVYKKTLLITHLNETCNSIRLFNGNLELADIKDAGIIDKIYTSDSKYAEDIKHFLG